MKDSSLYQSSPTMADIVSQTNPSEKNAIAHPRQRLRLRAQKPEAFIMHAVCIVKSPERNHEKSVHILVHMHICSQSNSKLFFLRLGDDPYSCPKKAECLTEFFVDIKKRLPEGAFLGP